MSLQDALAAANIPAPPSNIPISSGFVRYGKSNRYWLKQQDGVVLFGDWSTGESHHWFEDSGKSLDAGEVAARKAQLATLRQEQETEQARIYNEIATRTQGQWDGLPETGNSPYLERKQVLAYSLRFLGDAVVVPLRDIEGKLWSLQTINADGSKRFQTGGRKRGCFHTIGQMGNEVFIAEGYSTAASVHLATGLPVVVAFDAGNLEYEKVREAEAKRLNVRVGALDKEIEAIKKAQPVESGKPTMFPMVELWPEPVNAAELLSDIVSTIQRFIICERETAIAASLWCAFTWLVDRVQVAPLAVITPPEMRCGKSQLLNLIGLLSYRPLVASNISPSAMFRVIEAHQPTLLIDEADTFFKENEELRGVVNSGHTRQSAYVIRSVGDDHEPKQFSTWGAKAISGIGALAETIRDRAVDMITR